MKYIILAAGRGIRLSPISDIVPKVLLSTLDRRTLLERHITFAKTISACDEIIVISGYKSEFIDHKVRAIADSTSVPISVIHNPQWELSPLFSIKCASSIIRAHNCVIVNGDHLFKESIFTELENNMTDGLSLLVSKTDNPQPDQIKIALNNEGQFLELGKDISSQIVSAGMLVVCGQQTRVVFTDLVEKLTRGDSPIPKQWHSILNYFSHSGNPIQLNYVPFNCWQEIDHVLDIAPAHAIIENINAKSI